MTLKLLFRDLEPLPPFIVPPICVCRHSFSSPHKMNSFAMPACLSHMSHRSFYRFGILVCERFIRWSRRCESSKDGVTSRICWVKVVPVPFAGTIYQLTFYPSRTGSAYTSIQYTRHLAGTSLFSTSNVERWLLRTFSAPTNSNCVSARGASTPTTCSFINREQRSNFEG